jgi:hypothetical protein
MNTERREEGHKDNYERKNRIRSEYTKEIFLVVFQLAFSTSFISTCISEGYCLPAAYVGIAQHL